MFGNTETNFHCFIILTSALAVVLVSFWMSASRCRSSSTNSISKSLQYFFIFIFLQMNAALLESRRGCYLKSASLQCRTCPDLHFTTDYTLYDCVCDK